MVRHILKDGVVLDDITGHVVKQEDAPVVYNLIYKVNEEMIRRRENVDRRSSKGL